MPRLTVDPEQLVAAARAGDSAAAQAAGVAQAVGGVEVPDTGRPDLTARVAAVLAEAGSATTGIARLVSADCARLRSVGARYAAVEARVGGVEPCG